MFGDKLKGFEPYTPFTYSPGQIRLDANESPYDLPYELKDEIASEINRIAFNRYPDPDATLLRKAFADFYGINSANVVAGNGSDELIALILSSAIKKSSRVVVTKPDFSMYSFYSALGENEVLVFDKQKDLMPDIDALIDFINVSGAEVAVLSNPCNPTGGLISEGNLRIIADNVKATLIIDEAYMDFAPSSEQSLMKRACNNDNLIVLKTLSKSFGCAAARVGFAVGSPKTTAVLRTVKSPYNLNTVSQAVGRIVLSNKELAAQRLKAIIESRDNLYENLVKLDSENFRVFPTAANFIYIKSPKARHIADKLRKQNIIVRSFEDALRICAGTLYENGLLLKVLTNMAEKS